MKPHLIILTVALSILGMSSACLAQPTQAQSNPVTDNSGHTMPPGYTALILDMEGVKMRMTLEQRSDRGAYWPAWMRPGLEEGNSMYWWLLAQWHHNEGNRDLAYRTLLTAWVLTRMEGANCMHANSELMGSILRQHEAILNLGPSTNKAKQEAVLYSLNMGAKMTQRDPMRGMVCNISPARTAVTRQKESMARWEEAARAAVRAGNSPPQWTPPPPLNLIDYKVTKTGIERQNVLDQQRRELEIVGREFKANQAWETADINTIMKLVNKK